MTAERLGMTLLLAADAMFFAGLLAAFIVYRGARPEWYAEQARSLHPLLGTATLVALACGAASITVAARRPAAGRRRGLRVLTAAAGLIALGLIASEYAGLLRHRTVVAHDSAGSVVVYDGRTSADGTFVRIVGTARPLSADEPFDLHTVAPRELTGPVAVYDVPAAAVIQSAAYGPSRNGFFAAFYVLTMAVAVQVLVAVVAVARPLLTATGDGPGAATAAAAGNVALVWQFLAVVWAVLVAMLYLNVA